MGNSITGKMVVMMVVGVEGRGGGGGGLWQFRGQNAFLPSYMVNKKINPVRAGVLVVYVFVMAVTQTECELLRGAAPSGVVIARQLSAASQGLLEQCFCREEERERM